VLFRLKGRLEREGFDVRLIGLFPPVESKAETPAGQKCRPIVNYFSKYDKLTRVVLWGLKWWPIELKRLLVRLVTRSRPSPSVNQAAAELIDSLVARNIAFMAADELNVVNELGPKELDVLSSGYVYLYYGVSDHWAPPLYVEHMIERIGKDRVLIDKTGAEHAFVLKSSTQIAKEVVELLSTEESGN